MCLGDLILDAKLITNILNIAANAYPAKPMVIWTQI